MFNCANYIKVYDLIPDDSRKSFYGKARVYIDAQGKETLVSYSTPICTRDTSGNIIKHWEGWSKTTGRHIKAFCGMNKAEFDRVIFHEAT